MTIFYNLIFDWTFCNLIFFIVTTQKFTKIKILILQNKSLL